MIKKLTEEEIELVARLIYSGREPMMIVNEDIMELGQILKIKRTADGMTLSELAKFLKMSKGTLCEMERGLRMIPKSKVKAIDDYIYKTLFINGQLEFVMDDDCGENTID